MKAIESYWKGTVAVCPVLSSGFSCLVISDFPSKVLQKTLFDQTKERKKCFGIIAYTYFIFVDLCMTFLDLRCTDDTLTIPWRSVICFCDSGAASFNIMAGRVYLEARRRNPARFDTYHAYYEQPLPVSGVEASRKEVCIVGVARIESCTARSLSARCVFYPQYFRMRQRETQR